MTAEVEAQKQAPATKQKKRPKREEIVVEILKKPTGEVIRPSREKYNEEVNGLNDKIKECNTTLEEVKNKLDKMAEAKKSGDKTNEPQQKLNELKAKTRAIIDERKKVFDEMKKIKETRQALRDSNDSMRKSLTEGGCFSVAEVENKIRKLEYYLATNPLSVKEEKVVINDIKKLNASKKTIGEYDSMKGKKDSVEATSKELGAKLDASKVELEKAKAAEQKQYEIVSALRAKNNTKGEYQALFQTRDKARKEMNEHYDALRVVRATYRQQEDAWRKMMDEKRKEMREQKKKEQEMYQEEMRLQKLKDEEEAEENMHADKFASIDQLITYLNSLSATGSTKVVEEEQYAGEEGMEVIGKRAKDFDEDIFGTKKAGKKKGKKKGGKKKAGMSHDINVLQEFEKLKVEAPLSLEAIPATVTALKAKIDDLKKDKADKREKRLAKLKVAEAEVAAKKAKAEKAEADAKADGDKKEDKKEDEAKDEAKPAETAAPATESA